MGKKRSPLFKPGELDYEPVVWELSHKIDWDNFLLGDEAVDEEDDPERLSSFRIMINDLTSEAKEVVSVIFDTPIDLVKLVESKKKRGERGLSMSILRVYFRRQGWSFDSIDRVFHELREFVRKF